MADPSCVAKPTSNGCPIVPPQHGESCPPLAFLEGHPSLTESKTLVIVLNKNRRDHRVPQVQPAGRIAESELKPLLLLSPRIIVDGNPNRLLLLARIKDQSSRDRLTVFTRRGRSRRSGVIHGHDLRDRLRQSHREFDCGLILTDRDLLGLELEPVLRVEDTDTDP